MHSLTWAQVWAVRLARHALLEPAPAADLAAVAGTVCGIHAQVMPAAELSLGIRVAGITRRDVRAALWEQRSLVKTTGIRGTIHLFPAADLPLWTAALRTREPEDAKRLARQGVDPAQLDMLVAGIAETLDGQCLTLRQMDREIGQRLGAWATEVTNTAWTAGWARWRMALGTAAMRGVLCYGPPVGTEVTFARPDQWLGSWRDLDPQESLVEVFRRYLHAYGPATARDFAQWFSLPPRPARALADALAEELVEVDVEGDRGFLLAAVQADQNRRRPAAQQQTLQKMFVGQVKCFRSILRHHLGNPQGERPTGILLVDVQATFQREDGRQREYRAVSRVHLLDQSSELKARGVHVERHPFPWTKSDKDVPVSLDGACEASEI